MDEIGFKLKSAGDFELTVSRKAAKHSGTIMKHAEVLGLDDDESIAQMDPIDLSKFSLETLQKVVQWLEKHKDAPEWDEDEKWKNEQDKNLEEWKYKFIRSITDEEHFLQLYEAADFLDVKSLDDICASTIDSVIKDKPPMEILKIWNLEDGLTPGERQACRKEKPWDVIMRAQNEMLQSSSDEQEEPST